MTYHKLQSKYSSPSIIPYSELIRTKEWLEKRESIISRDHNKCTKCDKTPTSTYYNHDTKSAMYLWYGEETPIYNKDKNGVMVEVESYIPIVGTSSMIVGIRVEALNPKSGEVRHTNSCYFTMVAKDEEGKPTPVPGLLLTDEESLRRFAEGKALKNLAKQKRQLLKEEFHTKNEAELLSYLDGERMNYEI